MSTAIVYMKNGERHHFPDERRAGGSYTNTVRYEGGFVIVTDVWGKSRSWPAGDVFEVSESPRPRL